MNAKPPRIREKPPRQEGTADFADDTDLKTGQNPPGGNATAFHLVNLIFHLWPFLFLPFLALFLGVLAAWRSTVYTAASNIPNC